MTATDLRHPAENGDTAAGAGGEPVPAATTGPLDPGDRYGIGVHHGIADGMDVVEIHVPPGKGWLLAKWLERQLTETPDLREQRREQDTLAELTAERQPCPHCVRGSYTDSNGRHMRCGACGGTGKAAA